MTGNALPDLQAFAPGTHVLPQQQVIECDCADDIILLPDHLFNKVYVHAMLTHGGVEMVKMLQQDIHCSGPLGETAAFLPQGCLYGPQNPLSGLRLQHARDYTQDRDSI